MLASASVSFRKGLQIALFGLAVWAALGAALERDACAQLHGDVGVNLGVMRRVKTGPFPDSGEFGGVGEIEAHIAILPLLRVGGYFSHDIAPNNVDGSAWQITSGGVHVKVLAPIRGPFRAWVFAGLGYAGVYAPSYDVMHDFGDSQGSRNTDVTGAGGSFFELPFGVGGAWRFSKPWELTAQLGMRWNFGFTGSIYDHDVGRAVIPDGGPVYSFSSLGNDTWAPFLMIGFAFDK